MAKKKKPVTKKDSPLFWIILAVLVFALLVFAIFKLGLVGVFLAKTLLRVARRCSRGLNRLRRGGVGVFAKGTIPASGGLPAFPLDVPAAHLTADMMQKQRMPSFT